MQNPGADTPAAAIQGRVAETRHGTPVAGAVAALWAQGRAQAQALTTPAGTFRFADLQPGDYEVRVDRPGYRLARQRVTAAPGETAEVRLLLSGTGTISGRVRWRGGRGVGNVAVHAVREGAATAVARTREDGAYRLRDVPPGLHGVVAVHRRFGAACGADVAVEGDESVRDVEFEAIRAPSALLGRALLQGVADIWSYRHLLYNLVRRHLRTRYKESMLGLVWSMILPLAMIGTYTFVFKYVWDATRMPNYTMFLFCGLVPWLYFNHSMSDACNAVLSNRSLVTRVHVPPAVLPMAVVFQNLVHFFIMLFVFVAVLQFVPVRFFLPVVALPLLVVVQIVLNMGLAFFLAALNTFYQDVAYAVGVVLNFMLFLSPVLYSAPWVHNKIQAAGLPEWVYSIYMLNPVAVLTTAYRDIFLGHIVDGVLPGTKLADPAEWTPVFPEGIWLGVLAAEAVVLLVAGYVFFIKSQDRFSDVL